MIIAKDSLIINFNLVQYVHRAGTPGEGQSADRIDCMKRGMGRPSCESGQIALTSITVSILKNDARFNIVPVITVVTPYVNCVVRIISVL